MGESACLMQTFSQVSDTSHETSEGNPIHALAESVSFGRFLSESLDWEKWSSFSHNRYLEDVEKYSRPGSVAQKKAYFEAHYKKIAAKKAAALLEQENESASNTSQPETQDVAQNDAALVSHLTESDGHEAVDEPQQPPAPSMEEGFITDTSRCNSNVEMDHLETNKVEVEDPVIEDQGLEKNSLVFESLNQLADDENHGILTEVEPSGTTYMDQTHAEENVAASQETMTSATKAKPLVSSSKPSAYSRESTLSSSPAKSTSIRSRKGNIATPNSKKSARDSVLKKCSTPKSLHMSINFAANQETLALATKTKPAVTLSKPSAYSRVSRLQSPTSKSTTPVHCRKENNPTPNSKMSERDPGNKKCSTSMSLHMSINFAANQETLASATKTKPAVSLSKPSAYSRVSGLQSPTSKSTTPVHCEKENNPTPNSKISERDPGNKKCSMPKALHMSINFAVNQETLASATKTKPVVSSSKPSLSSRASKLPSLPGKSTTPVHSRKENSATPNNKKSAGGLVTKKCSAPKSLHMSIGFTPSGTGETNKTSSVWQKIADSRRSGSLSTSKHCPTPLRTPTTASVNGLPKNPSISPQSEKRSTRSELDLTAFGSSKEGAKWQSLSIDHSKSLNACGGITRTATLSSPFSFRTDERAAKRKEKLENKYNAEGAQNEQLQMKSKEKAESELKKLHQSLGFKAKPMPDYYRETESGKNQKQISLTHLRPPKLGRKPSSNAVQDRSSLPPRRPAVKNDNSKIVIEKNNQIPTHSITAPPNEGAHDNSSPNIQD
ncbi:endochitinase A-like [Telopea speciosissima]|uniref:endochitinase A-like n=1 Tax=Telopea speciosissima TaxID=54955 RepID=UPI001CC552C8|nr:endochitinase A-like [Telopea speciosissima]